MARVSDGKEIVFNWPILQRTGSQYVNITIGNLFIKDGEEGNYTLTITVYPHTGLNVELYIEALGVVATPNMGLYGLAPQYAFWGDSIGPLAVAMIHYYPEMKNEVLSTVKAALREILEWKTDAMFYPPDKRWVFLYWDKSRWEAKPLKPPSHGVINYASLEETLTGMIPLLILTGDPELRNLTVELAKLLSHDNYWKGLGYWSAWFGIWTHLYLYNITGDKYFWDEPRFYLGVMWPFNQSLNEEISNAAKFIEANIVAYYMTGDEKYLEIAHEMADILVEEYRNPTYGFLTPYRDSDQLARHDMLAWTASPLISLYIGTWAPDWMLWLYPIAYSDNRRPNGYFTPLNVTYTPNAIYIWNSRSIDLFLFKYSGFILSPLGFKSLKQTPPDYFPYVARLELLNTSSSTQPVLVGFNSTKGSFMVKYGEDTMSIKSSTTRTWIIKIDPEKIDKVIVDNIEYSLDKLMIYHNYLVVTGSSIIIQYH